MTDQQGSWGGARPGAGNPEFKPKWKSGKTTVIRVPEAIADEVLVIARQIDEGSTVTLSSDGAMSQLEEENARLRQKLQECQSRLEEAAVTQSSERSVEPSALFNQLRPLLNRLNDRERRAIQQKLEEILD
jgi:hypothetical protein